ncbi:MAG: hypothetical protein N3F09_06955 [Bacteroidia bacterium]|nr:hypothetical protein [Bacteroidia bacterium]
MAALVINVPSQTRKLFLMMDKSETDCKKLMEITSNFSNDPLMKAYHAASVMTSAQYAFWPFEKLKRFNEGKTLLESAVNEAPQNVEIRWIRYNVQKHSPAFLNYNNHLKDDKVILMRYVDEEGSKDLELNKLILQTL